MKHFIYTFVLLTLLVGCSPVPTKTKAPDVEIEKSMQDVFIEAVMATQHRYGQAAIDYRTKNNIWPGDEAILTQYAVSQYPDMDVYNIKLTGVRAVSSTSYEIYSISKPNKKSPRKYPIELALTVNFNPPTMALTSGNLDGFKTSSDHSLNSSDKLFGLKLSLEFKSKYGDKIKIEDVTPSTSDGAQIK